eukprot:1150701-Pelagomonas_calceolata.AAC.1
MMIKHGDYFATDYDRLFKCESVINIHPTLQLPVHKHLAQPWVIVTGLMLLAPTYSTGQKKTSRYKNSCSHAEASPGSKRKLHTLRKQTEWVAPFSAPLQGMMVKRPGEEQKTVPWRNQIHARTL